MHFLSAQESKKGWERNTGMQRDLSAGGGSLFAHMGEGAPVATLHGEEKNGSVLHSAENCTRGPMQVGPCGDFFQIRHTGTLCLYLNRYHNCTFAQILFKMTTLIVWSVWKSCPVGRRHSLRPRMYFAAGVNLGLKPVLKLCAGVKRGGALLFLDF